jgi:acyl-coenzyme A thioesterase PaaI-like protein
MSFSRQGLMSTLGATLVSVGPGLVEISLRPTAAISQQHGFVHAGAVSTIADTAAGYAALTMMPANRGVLTAEFKTPILEQPPAWLNKLFFKKGSSCCLA